MHKGINHPNETFMEIHSTIQIFFKDYFFGTFWFDLYLISPFISLILGLDISKNKNVDRLFYATLQDASVTKSITKYTHSGRKFNKESIVDTQVLVELLFQAILECFSTLHVLHLLAKSRPRDSLISILASIQGAFVREVIIKRIYSDWKFDKESPWKFHSDD